MLAESADNREKILKLVFFVRSLLSIVVCFFFATLFLHVYLHGKIGSMFKEIQAWKLNDILIRLKRFKEAVGKVRRFFFPFFRTKF